MTISLSPETQRRLEQCARAAGQDVSAFVERIIVRELAAPLSLTEAAEPFARAVEASGISDDQFTALLLEARDDARSQRRQDLE